MIKKFSIDLLINAIRLTLGKGHHNLHEPFLGKDEVKYLSNAVKRNSVSTKGIYVPIFEDKIKNYTKSNYVISTINGTEAIFISLKALGVKKDEEVLMPALTFVGTANAVRYLGANPHFVDSNIKDFGIDCEKLEKYLKRIVKFKNKKSINKYSGKKISAIIAVHVFGHPCDIEKIKKISKKYNLIVIEDAAACLGSFYKNKHLGTFGDIGCLSFNGNKIITTGGGGALLIKKRKVYLNIKHIITTAKVNHDYEFYHNEIGYNLRLPSLNAAMGVAQIKKINIFVKLKRKLFLAYQETFKKILQIKLFKENNFSRSNYWLQTIILDKNIMHLKNKIIKKAHEKKIFMRPVWKLISSLKPYRNFQKMNLSGAIEIYKRVINIPSSPKLIAKKIKIEN